MWTTRWITIQHWFWHIRPGTTRYLLLGIPRSMISREGEQKHAQSSLHSVRRLARLVGSLRKLSRIVHILWRPTTNHTINLQTPPIVSWLSHRMVSRKSASAMFPPLAHPRSNFVNALVRRHILDPQTHHKLQSTKPSISVVIPMTMFHSFHLLLIPSSSSVTDVRATAMRL